MFIAIRKYSGCKDPAEINRRIVASLVPILRKMPGFRSYTTMDIGGGVVASISEFDSRADAEYANNQARELVRQTLTDLVPNPPEITVGETLSQVRI